MKTKITYLFLILPLLTFAQWEFNTSNTEGWSVSQGGSGAPGTLSATATAIEYTTLDGTSGNTSNPKFTNTTASIDATTNNQIEVSVKNASGATYLRLSATIGGVVTTYNCVISAGDINYKIYKFTYDTPGTITALSLEFKLSDGLSTTSSGNSYVPKTSNTANKVISIDYIRPQNFVTPIKNTFNFDTTTEGFTTLSRATVVQATESSRATLKINCNTAVSTNARVALSLGDFRVEGTNKYAHITLKNTSNNTLFQLNGKVSGVVTLFNPIQTYTTLDGDYKTYDFDLSTWDNGSQSPELIFGVKDTWLATSTYVTGDRVISGNTYCKNKTGNNSTGLGTPANVPHTDTTNWDIVNEAGLVANSPLTNGAILGGALNINATTNSVYIDSIIFDTTLSTADFGNANTTISLFPNPANDVLNISSSNNISNIEVYDMQGRNVASNHNDSNVNVAALGKGAYIVKVVQENGSVIAKQFIKK